MIGLFLRKKDTLWIVEKQKISYLCWCSSNMLEVHDRKKGVSLKEYELKIRGETHSKCLPRGGGVGLVRITWVK